MSTSSARFRDELAESIEKTLVEQARKNEITIGWGRAVTPPLGATGAWRGYFIPPAIATSFPISIPLISTSYALVAWSLLLVLRRGFYRSILRTVVPTVDGLFIGAALLNLASSFTTDVFRGIDGS